MDSSDLKPEQAAKMLDALAPAVAYLQNLESRMQKKSFDRNDELCIRTRRARIAMLHLVAELRQMANVRSRTNDNL